MPRACSPTATRARAKRPTERRRVRRRIAESAALNRIPDTSKALLGLGLVAALFAWSVWAGLAGLGAGALWVAWIVGGDLRHRRALERACLAQVSAALAERGLAPGAVFHGRRGVGALGVDASGRVFVSVSSEGCERFEREAVLGAAARRLPQGEFVIGITVAGRVTGRPYGHELVVARRHARRWVGTVRPLLGDRLTADACL